MREITHRKPIWAYTLKEVRKALEQKDYEIIARALDYLLAHMTAKPLIFGFLSKWFGVDLFKYVRREA